MAAMKEAVREVMREELPAMVHYEVKKQLDAQVPGLVKESNFSFLGKSFVAVALIAIPALVMYGQDKGATLERISSVERAVGRLDGKTKFIPSANPEKDDTDRAFIVGDQ